MTKEEVERDVLAHINNEIAFRDTFRKKLKEWENKGKTNMKKYKQLKEKVEYINQIIENYKKKYKGYLYQKKGDWRYFVNHRGIVEQALKEGKPVPDKVLKDYPDLLKKYGKKVKITQRTNKTEKRRNISTIMAKVRQGKKLTKSEREYMSKFMKQVKRKQREALSKKYAKLTKKDLEALFAKRSKRSRSIDKKKRAKKVITKPEEYFLWVRAPRHYDIKGIDTPKK